MSVAYTSYEAQVIEAVINMIAGSVNFRTLVSAADSTAAKNYIIELDGGDETENATGAGCATACNNAVLNRGTALGWAHVCPEVTDFSPETHALVTWSRNMELPVRIWWKRTAADTPPERRRRGLNILGTIRADLESQLGGATYLRSAQITTRLLPEPDDTGWAKNFDTGLLTISWRSLP